MRSLLEGHIGLGYGCRVAVPQKPGTKGLGFRVSSYLPKRARST